MCVDYRALNKHTGLCLGNPGLMVKNRNMEMEIIFAKFTKYENASFGKYVFVFLKTTSFYREQTCNKLYFSWFLVHV